MKGFGTIFVATTGFLLAVAVRPAWSLDPTLPRPKVAAPARSAEHAGGAGSPTTNPSPAARPTSPSPASPQSPATQSLKQPSAPPAASTQPAEWQVPATFTRQWESPETWVGKPEQGTCEAGKVSIVNEGGANTVCKDEPLQRQADGTFHLSWNYGPSRTGFEIWSWGQGKVRISRWNDRGEFEAGRAPRRIGSID